MPTTPWIRRTRSALLVLFSILLLLYLWIAFMPVGHRPEMMAENADAARKVTALIHKTPEHSTGPDPAKPMPVAESEAPGLEPSDKSRPSRLAECAFVDAFARVNSDYLSQDPDLLRACDWAFPPNGLRWFEKDFPKDVFEPLKPGDIKPYVARMTQQIKEAILAEASAITFAFPIGTYSNYPLLSRSLPIGAEPTSATLRSPQWWGQPLHDTLDAVELFFDVRSWERADMSPFKRFANPDGLSRLALLAMARADMRGDGAKAGRILCGYLVSIRAAHLASYPIGFGRVPGSESAGLLGLVPLAAGEFRSIPDSAFAQADRILQSALLTEDQKTLFMKALADRVLQDTNAHPVSMKEVRGEGPLSMFGRSVLFAPMKPVLRGTLNQVARQWSQGKGMTVAQAVILNGLKNEYEGLPEFSPLTNPYMFDWLCTRRGHFNQTTHLMRAALAAARWRRANKHYPASIQDLVSSDYLDHSYLEPDRPTYQINDINWAVMRMTPDYYRRARREQYERWKRETGRTDPQQVEEEKPVFAHFEPCYASGEFVVRARIGFYPGNLVNKEILAALFAEPAKKRPAK